MILFALVFEASSQLDLRSFGSKRRPLASPFALALNCNGHLHDDHDDGDHDDDDKDDDHDDDDDDDGDQDDGGLGDGEIDDVGDNGDDEGQQVLRPSLCL